jgi:lysozyme
MLNQATINLVKEFEGCRLTAYKDSAGVWTIGYGTTGRAGLGIDPVEGMEITEVEAEYYLQKGLEKFAMEITGAFTRAPNENQFGAFVSLAYNIGSGAFKRSTALKKFNEGDDAGAANAILMWNKAGGKVLNGLIRRREAERKLFLTPVSVDAPISDIKPDRQSASQSRTIQASVVQGASAVGGAVGALSALDGTVQIVALVGCFIIAGLALFIMRERLRHWANGVR